MQRSARQRLHADLVRLADGDRGAFDPVYAATWPLARQLAQRTLGEGPEAEDCAQRALIKVFERAHHFDPSRGEALPWILGVVYWECRSAMRRGQRRREEGPAALPGLRAPGPSPEARIIDQDMEQALIEIMGILRPADRETLSAAMGAGPRPDVAAATFRKRLQRATQRLRSAWRERHGSS